jgi:CheY-like chemotaxis protein
MEFAQSAPAALQCISDAGNASLILILSDINMPGMSGLELLPKAKAVRPDVPVIMITAYGDAETKRKALESGADALFTKPIDFVSLRGEIIPGRTSGGRRIVCCNALWSLMARSGQFRMSACQPPRPLRGCERHEHANASIVRFTITGGAAIISRLPFWDCISPMHVSRQWPGGSASCRATRRTFSPYHLSMVHRGASMFGRNELLHWVD